jgi:hypothetical protein
LFDWAIDVARENGATQLIIDSDPCAAPFYRRMGAYDLGQAPSGSVPGRMLPRLAINLCPTDQSECGPSGQCSGSPIMRHTPRCGY